MTIISFDLIYFFQSNKDNVFNNSREKNCFFSDIQHEIKCHFYEIYDCTKSQNVN